MRSGTAFRQGMSSDLVDRDLDLVIDGIQPFNDDLAPLESFVNSLGSFADIAPSPEFLEYHAAEAAATAQTPPAAPVGTGGRRPGFGLRRRGLAGATSLMMILGMTGVAWASDSAVPGDWNYGIDRALESMGIGAGGAEERIQDSNGWARRRFSASAVSNSDIVFQEPHGQSITHTPLTTVVRPMVSLA